MKKLIFTGVAALMLVATGCKGGSTGSNELAAQQDTLATAVGELAAAAYAQQTSYMPDSLQFDKAELLKGMQSALAADTTLAGKSYLAGLQLGMQVMQMIQSIEVQSKTKIDKAKVIEAFKLSIAPDSITVKMEDADSKVMASMGKIKELQLANDPEAIANKKATEGFIAQIADKPNAHKPANGLVYEVIEEGTDVKVNASDMVYAIFSIKSKDGQELQSTQGKPTQLPASRFENIHPTMAEGITSMHQGGHCVFYVNAGVNVPQGLKPFDVLIIDVQLTTAEAAAAAQTANN